MNRRFTLKVLKIGLPLIAAATAGAVILFSGGGYDDRVTFDGVEIDQLEDGLKLTNPRFTGATAKGEPFVVSAEWALPDGPRPRRVDLSKVKGEVTLAGGRVVTASALTGVLEPRANVVTLAGDVAVETSDGYRLTAGMARLVADEDRLTAEGGVVATGPMGRIEAERMRVERNGASGPGDYIWFENRVKVRIDRPNMAQDPG